MNQAITSQRTSFWRKIAVGAVLGVSLLLLGTAGSTLWADATNAAPVNPSPAAAEGDFGQYLVDHQSDLAPVFSKYGDDLMKQALILFLRLLGSVVLLTLVAGWAIDVFLSRCFSAFFAPVYAKLRRAFVYATGQLLVNVVMLVLLGLTIALCTGLPYFQIIVLVSALVLLGLMVMLQTGWVAYLYRTSLPVSAIFYLAVFIIHIITGILVAAPIFGARASDDVTGFVDQSVTPKLQAEIDSMKHELTTASAERDAVKAKVADAEEQLTQAQGQQQELEKSIQEKKNSEAYLFSQIMKVEAGGDLAAAHDQLTDFLTKFPAGLRTAEAKAQLAQVDSGIAAQVAQKKQAEADAALATAQARADLLLRAGKGEVTLSEMRLALIGKPPAYVSAMFGPAVETGSDRWGYSQRMIVNPLTGEKFGLTVNFEAGVVQGVDYYYGTGGPK